MGTALGNGGETVAASKRQSPVGFELGIKHFRPAQGCMLAVPSRHVSHALRGCEIGHIQCMRLVQNVETEHYLIKARYLHQPFYLCASC